jgi:hypothetical protein
LIHRIARGFFGLIRRLIHLLRSAFGQIFHSLSHLSLACSGMESRSDHHTWKSSALANARPLI